MPVASMDNQDNAKILGDLSLRIEGELPAELNRLITFRLDNEEAPKYLVIEWQGSLPPENLQLLTAVVCRYDGDFINTKDGKNRDRGYFQVPLPKPKPEPAPKEQLVASPPAASHATTVAMPKAGDQPLKQPGPVSLYREKYCSTCEDVGRCRLGNSTEGMKLCLKVMELQFLDGLSERLHKICLQLELATVNLSKIALDLQRRPAPSTSIQQPASQNRSASVQHNAQSAEVHVEGGIAWRWDKNRDEEPYEKALEKDNMRSDAYFALRKRLFAKLDEGKKGLVDADKWYWLSKEKDFIGRKPAKTFTRGGR